MGAERPDEARLRSFAKKVRAMRDLQKRFFAGERSVVGEAKKLEREVDRMADDIIDVTSMLFDRGEAHGT